MSYFESRLRLNFEDLNNVKEKLRLCEKLGINHLILESKGDFKAFNFALKERVDNCSKINLYFRFNLIPNSVNELKKMLKNYNHFPYILSIESPNKDIQIQAAKDSRIDIVSFSNYDILKTITPGVISLIKQNNSFIEFSLEPIMEDKKVTQSKNFRILYKFIQLALRLKVNFIISGNFDKLYDFRNPRALISVCHTLLEVPLVLVKKAFSKNPRMLLIRVKNRQNLDIYENGVKIIQG